jgi:glutamine amidotransferase
MNLSFISALNPTGAVNQSILRSLDNVHRRPIATLWRGLRPPLFAFDNRAPLLIIALGNRALLLISLITTKLSLISAIFAKNDGQRRLILCIISRPGRLWRNRRCVSTLLWRAECRYDSPSGKPAASKAPVHNKANSNQPNLMIAIVDYKAGNLTSVARALDHLGHRCEITDQPARLRAADRMIIPGVGAAGATMENLRALELTSVLRDDVARTGKLFLGICIGIQVLLDRSAEDNADCLGIIPGKVVRFPSSVDGRPLKVPQIGWNRVRQTRPHPLFAGVPDNTHFYFVNSYYPEPSDPAVTIATSDYGVTFTAAIARDNVIATQFHLEKSGTAGLRMLDNFCRLKI